MELSAMARILLWFVTLLFAVVSGDVITRTPLNPPTGMKCLAECQIFDNGTLVIINITNPKQAVSGVAYSTAPVRMRDARRAASFNTSFTFREEPMRYNATALDQRDALRGDGFVFAIVNSSSWVGGPAGRLGMFKDYNNPKIVAIEFDNWRNAGTDTDYREHVGLNIGNASSICTAPIYPLGISFWKRDTLHSWIEYDGVTLQVRVANTTSRPVEPLLNCTVDLFGAVDEKMWIGFAGSHGDAWSVYYISNWSFSSFGISGEFASVRAERKIKLIVGLASAMVMILVVVLGAVVYVQRSRRERRDSWEDLLGMAHMPEFISYKQLSAATKEFSDDSKLGAGGFGSVYKGVLPKTGALVAVKKVSNDSKQGEKEFLAEVQIISQLRHRNVVELLGFCKDRGKFLLVYELLPNGSLDQALFKPKTQPLPWNLRWKIVSGTAAALHYLHEGWRQQVIHRDVKSSNIMLDDEYNPKLGDFGLARLVDHQKNVPTTMVGGTYGYLAPEATGGKFTDKTDVYAFGAVALELACGRKAFTASAEEDDDIFLVDMVWRALKEGNILRVVDSRLQGEFDATCIEKLLLLGLLCSHPNPAARPCMRTIVQVLAGEAPVPPVPSSKPESIFSAEIVSVYKRRLSGSRSRSSRSAPLDEHSKRMLLDNFELSLSHSHSHSHSSVVESGLTGPLSSFPSEPSVVSNQIENS